MAAPTLRARTFPISTAEAAVDTDAERIGVIAGSGVISTGDGNELDFGDVNISGGAADSLVKMLILDITADGGNDTAENFKIWASSNGLDDGDSVVNIQPLSGADQGTPTLTENYIVDAEVADYTWAEIPSSEPATNIYRSDETGVLDISGGASDDAIMLAMYIHIAAGETLGTYKGLDAGNEFRLSVKFTYA